VSEGAADRDGNRCRCLSAVRSVFSLSLSLILRIPLSVFLCFLTLLCILILLCLRYRGLLRQFLQEDKGVTLIAVFGLPLLSFENDSTRYTEKRIVKERSDFSFSLRCVKAALKLESELRAVGLTASIGITTGRREKRG
jgi:hypothetical protein